MVMLTVVAVSTQVYWGVKGMLASRQGSGTLLTSEQCCLHDLSDQLPWTYTSPYKQFWLQHHVNLPRDLLCWITCACCSLWWHGKP